MIPMPCEEEDKNTTLTMEMMPIPESDPNTYDSDAGYNSQESVPHYKTAA